MKKSPDETPDADRHAAPGPGPRVAEQLSAWLDDELPAAETGLLAARFRGGAEPEGRARLARYALTSAVLRGEGSRPALGVARRVAAALDADATTQPVIVTAGRDRSAPRSGLWFGAGLAAAFAAAIAVTATLTAPAGMPGSTPLLAAAPVAAVAGGAFPDERLTNYLVYHGEYSGALSARLVDTHVVGHHNVAAVALP
jgi:hypothetical protein